MRREKKNKFKKKKKGRFCVFVLFFFLHRFLISLQALTAIAAGV